MQTTITIEVRNSLQQVLKCASDESSAILVYDQDYEPGHQIIVSLPKGKHHTVVQIDETLQPSCIYLPDSKLEFSIPFSEELLGYPPDAFAKGKHTISAHIADKNEIFTYRNLALNVMDQRKETNCYPHVIANVETRGEAVFAARNTIDGITSNSSHGIWPFLSWGDDENPDAEITLFFGRKVKVDKMILYLRADFPHDSYWKEITAVFSDGSSLKLYPKKTGNGQEFSFDTKQIEWIKLLKLLKADDPSPFPAFSQWEVYGTDY